MQGVILKQQPNQTMHSKAHQISFSFFTVCNKHACVFPKGGPSQLKQDRRAFKGSMIEIVTTVRGKRKNRNGQGRVAASVTMHHRQNRFSPCFPIPIFNTGVLNYHAKCIFSRTKSIQSGRCNESIPNASRLQRANRGTHEATQRRV